MTTNTDYMLLSNTERAKHNAYAIAVQKAKIAEADKNNRGSGFRILDEHNNSNLGGTMITTKINRTRAVTQIDAATLYAGGGLISAAKSGAAEDFNLSKEDKLRLRDSSPYAKLSLEGFDNDGVAIYKRKEIVDRSGNPARVRESVKKKQSFKDLGILDLL